ncbi:alanine racemase domain protein [Planctopirus limnophila DSM 3776]|uniref:Alanine racemase domain protein n=1 Tax=Planctopirus limnophila (strain ATCC 43296 / DSM 3776 / IFAM 1008 / Mu 290) TaxID=521674 RepID=D5SS12_PLAL2|nr:D-TA family PLP-dependent enzyme [Planctopirus limnophila]ADG68736.1 alanine racemase domain protein [Planctopirus limnophila DSM 3776]
MRWTPPLAPGVAEAIPSPALIIDLDAVRENLDHMLAVSGGPERLRPHCKTHKMLELSKLEVARGIRRHKAATFAEAEMLARAGAIDVLLAYPLVGPNLRRAAEFRHRFPGTKLTVLADDARTLDAMSEMTSTAGITLDVLLDLNVGMNRTGVDPRLPESLSLYQKLIALPGLNAAGLHVYDGHLHQTNIEERAASVRQVWEMVQQLRERLRAAGIEVGQIVCGGTGTFDLWSQVDDPAIELSPGTCVLHDWGYALKFPEMNYRAAAFVLSRVISRPTADRLTLDLGHKAVSPDQAMGHRVWLPELIDSKQVLQSEEHLVIESHDRDRMSVGDVVWGIPRHVCTTVPLYPYAIVAQGGEVVDRWEISARNRQWTI